MPFPSSPYIEERDGELYVPGHRVLLSTIVVQFREGCSPERIVEGIPTLSRAQVYGAIAYYLENEKLIDEHIAEVEREFYRTVPPLSVQAPELYARLEEARRQMRLKSA